MRMRMAAALVIATAVSAGAWADSPAANAAAGEQWDDSHMQSRHAATPRTTRPRLEGESGYGALVNGTATASAPAVRELVFTTQREWVQGPISKATNENEKAAVSASTQSGSGGISRGSALRAGAQSSRQRR